MHHVQCAHYRGFIAARLDPDGNEISTDEEEMVERARTITRRNNPQPFFSLFQPVGRASNDGPATPGDDTGGFEAQTPARSDHTDTAQSSGTIEGTLEVGLFLWISRGMSADGATSICHSGFP